jgi:hypothetical protein
MHDQEAKKASAIGVIRILPRRRDSSKVAPVLAIPTASEDE